MLRVNRSWRAADRATVQHFEMAHGKAPLLLPNGVRPNRLGDLVGEHKVIQNKRSIRQYVKKLLRLEFKSQEFK
ncbi:MAG: hypothetical protein HC880_08630 [Bacteroidia bacterium]|nr:hypothetical protein [Bacteroidia bacterium]